MTRAPRARVLIAGGGIGALAGALALREYAPSGVGLTLLAPGPDLVLVPETVLEATGGPPAGRYSLGAIAADLAADLVPDVLEAVDTEQQHAGTRESGLLGYDALLIAVGARPGPGVPGALRFAGARDAAALRAALESLGPRPRVLFTTGAGVGWTLPLYELALLTAARHPEASVAVATPEPRPAAVFGAAAGREVTRRLMEAGIDLRAGVLPESAEDGALWLAEGGSIKADLVVALPQPAGPGIAGLPADAHGFLPVDRYGHVKGADRVWAAGDATARPLKQGGLAALGTEDSAERRRNRGASPVISTPRSAGSYGMGTMWPPSSAAIERAATSACCAASPPCLSGRAVASPAAQTRSAPLTWP